MNDTHTINSDMMMNKQNSPIPISPLAQRMAAEDRANSSITPIHRAEVTMAVFGILRDNIKDSISSQDELIQISKAIEKKLYQTAPSPREYRSMGTIELRIKAYATALLLIHSDGILASQCRNSLPLCAMALVRYEKQNLKTTSLPPRKATPDVNVRSIPQQIQQPSGYHKNMQRTSSKMILTGEEKRAATAAKYFLSQMVNVRATSGYEKQKAVQQEGVGYGHRTTMQQAIMSDSCFRLPFPPSA